MAAIKITFSSIHSCSPVNRTLYTAKFAANKQIVQNRTHFNLREYDKTIRESRHTEMFETIR